MIPFIGWSMFDFALNSWNLFNVSMLIGSISIGSVTTLLGFRATKVKDVTCQNCGRQTHSLPGGKLPWNHRTGQCKVSKQEGRRA